MSDERRPFFSIIMPIFNSEKYLERAIDSVLSQSFKNFELILVEDGSTDRSWVICENYRKRDSRINLISTEKHIGVANARNEGLKFIKGRYFTFIDADDWIEADLYEKVYKTIGENQVEVLKYGCIEEYFSEEESLVGTRRVSFSDFFSNNPEKIKENVIELEMGPLFGYVWNTFYLTDLIKTNKINFNSEMNVNEDFDFNIRTFEYVKRFCFIDYCGYHYAKRPGNSLSTNENLLYYDIHKYKISQLLCFYRNIAGIKNTKVVFEKIYWLYTRIVFSSVCREIETGKNYKTLLNEVFSSPLFSEYERFIFTDIDFKQRVLINVLQRKSILQIYLLCLLICFVKNKFRVVFAKIKK